MDDRDLLEELVRVATRLGVQVRIEPFETPPARGGGRCVVDGREFILIDARAPLGDRLGALAAAMSDLDLEDIYVTPEARDRVERERDARIVPRESVALAPLTTMGVGGPARWYVEARDEAAVLAALAVAEARGLSLRVLGGGSNLVVSDAGVDALVLRVALRGLSARELGSGGRADRGGRRAMGRRGPLRRRAGLGRARVPERYPRPRRRDADPECRRLRPGGERHDRGRARARSGHPARS